ncbi:MAG: hypothetical protein WCX82_03085 [archaeon]|jgi:hypothetical protein
MFKNKGQLSIEVLIILIFLITFIYVYNNLGEQTVYTLEVNKIKEQEQGIAISLNEFLESQKSILYDSSIIDYNSTYRLSNISIPSKKVVCYVDINLDISQMLVISDYSNINTVYNSTISNTEFILPHRINCGQEIICDLNTGKIECN